MSWICGAVAVAVAVLVREFPKMACTAMLGAKCEVDGSLRWRETQVWKSERERASSGCTIRGREM